MASLNKVMLIGNAGKDADLRYTANGTATATFSLAVNNRRRGASGEWEDNTEWFNIVLFAETAERLAQYITKGKPVYVEGRQQTRTWENDAGVKQYRTEVIANTVQLLGQRDDGQARAPDPEYVPPAGRAPSRDGQRYQDRAAKAGGYNDRSAKPTGPYMQAQQAAADIADVDIDDLPFE